MELVIALSIIFSVIALFTAIYACEELVKLRDRIHFIQIKVDYHNEQIERILGLTQSVLDNNDRMIKYIDALEDRTKKEE